MPKMKITSFLFVGLLAFSLTSCNNCKHTNEESLVDKYYGVLETKLTGAKFAKEYRGKTENEIMIGKESKFGFAFPNRVSKKGSQIILDNGKKVDMKHFMVVGRKGHVMGIVNELSQIGTPSFFSSEDLYSNKLGINFFENYGALIEKNPTKISTYIYWFLSDPENINL
jgi:hypothetical protein